MSTRRRTYNGDEDNDMVKYVISDNYTSGYPDYILRRKIHDLDSNETFVIEISEDDHLQGMSFYTMSPTVWTRHKSVFVEDSGGRDFSDGFSDTGIDTYVKCDNASSLIGKSYSDILSLTCGKYGSRYSLYGSIIIDISDESFHVFPGSLMMDMYNGKMYWSVKLINSALDKNRSVIYALDSSFKVGRLVHSTSEVGLTTGISRTMYVNFCYNDKFYGTYSTSSETIMNCIFSTSDLSRIGSISSLENLITTFYQMVI